MDAEYVIEPLPDEAIRKGFSCGVSRIDTFLKRYAVRQHNNGQVRVHVAVHKESQKILGFISLCLKTYESDLSEESKEIYNKVEAVPTVYLAMLGVSTEFQKKGIGGALLWYAFEKSVEIANIAGTYALTLNAKNDSLCQYYENLGFIRMSKYDETRTMYLPISTMRAAINRACSANEQELNGGIEEPLVDAPGS